MGEAADSNTKKASVHAPSHAPSHAPLVHPFRHESSGSFSYVLIDGATNAAVVIDPVFDAESDRGNTADAILAFVHSNRLIVHWILETHIHADHLSAAAYLRDRLPGAQIACSEGVREVKTPPSGKRAAARSCTHLGADRLLKDGESISFGRQAGHAIKTPGHTPSCMTYLFADCAFVGDTLFMPDSGTARCDFPGGSASQLYASVQKILALPDHTRLFLCHDYLPPERDACYQTTVGAQLAHNIHVKQDVPQCDFVSMRTQRDAGLSPPKMMSKAVPFNVHVLQNQDLGRRASGNRATPHSKAAASRAHYSHVRERPVSTECGTATTPRRCAI